ncbi:MscS family inner membrane protein YnaI [Limihaloglobus sulfuriphilus]|uniref:MscS family inner membrane protein YnaI n=1 Tax=Limihaloglobus sulfuriphilus TaxID=1851148 RepID=A0A1Q2MF33_9BACT|nr:mechanosensitive ion channel domain-containing protein [Limihaloglobus sulfuriphilus]AQQ71158.1 MscS family inner membrane protein YnaI [Limihaloglobus sulfuriphilus]
MTYLAVIDQFTQWLDSIKYYAVFFIALMLAAFIINFILFKVMQRMGDRIRYLPCNSFTKHCSKPLKWVLILTALSIFIKFTPMKSGTADIVSHFMTLAIIAVGAWLIIKLTYVLDDFVTARFSVDKKDNLRARKVQTQLHVTKRIIIVIVSTIAIGAMLMTFENIRQIGTAILASAGIIGIIVGMAAQRTLGNFIAGLQIAFTQPIRIDDVVIVENEWGRIEEINLTYVVVKIWDQRRLIVPINYFIENSFQNWTRTSSDILGTVYIYTDYRVPVEAIRKQLQSILEESEHWDKKVCVLQVTNATESSVELRALMSAQDASTAWTLRCQVREKLIEFIRDEYSQSLPRTRIEMEKPEQPKA